MNYRKKPVVIEAVQWWPPGDERHDPSMLVKRKGNTVDPPDYLQPGDLFQFSTIAGMGDDVFMVKTLEGDMRVSPGDWIITGVQGEKYPCKPDIFDKTYEPAEQSIVPRPSVMAFAIAMETKLRKHDATKGGQKNWRKDPVNHLVSRIDDELAELFAAVECVKGDPSNPLLRDLAAAEAVDVANFAMMVHDVIAPLSEDAHCNS